MGNENLSAFVFNEQNMIDAVYRNIRAFCTSYDLVIPNCYTSSDNEADILAVRKSGLCDEFEIKISRSDFLADAKKMVNFRDCDWNGIDKCFLDANPNWKFENVTPPWVKHKRQALVDGDMHANHFWYVIKSGEVEVNEVPSFAGLIFVNENGESRLQRMPDKLHKRKVSLEEQLRLSKKLHYRFWDYRLGKR